MGVKVKVVKKKSVIFSYFLNTLIKMERYPWTRRGILEEIPEELVKKASNFDRRLPRILSYKRHPLKAGVLFFQ